MLGSFSEDALNKANELLYGEFPGAAKPAAQGTPAKLKWKVQEDGTVIPAEPEKKPTAPSPKEGAPNAAMAAASNGARNKVGQKKGLAIATAKQNTAGGKAGVQSQLSKLNAGG
jgi:predicted metal-dependent phosphoesterase TrpH